MRLLIKNAEIYDGVNQESFYASVLIDGDRITDVLFEEPQGYEGETLDGNGLCLAPGFIDTHSHNDFYTTTPGSNTYIRPFIRQGITSMVAGQCGFSTIGIDPNTPYEKDLFSFFLKNPNYKDVSTFDGWKSAVDKYSPVNIACFCGHGTIRTSLCGSGPGALSESQMEVFEKCVDESLQSGAAGLSFGLMYDPSMFGTKEELIRLAKIAAKHNKPISFHARALSKVSLSYPELLGRAHNLRALDEILDIARQSGAKTHISHIIFVGRNTWPTLNETVSMIDNANKEGLDVSFDIYPFDFGASTINVALPSWYQGLSADEKKKIGKRIKLKTMILATKKLLGFGFEDIQITWAGQEHPEYIGKRISEIAKIKNMSQLNTYLNIVDECGIESTVIMYTYMNDHIIDTLSRHERAHYMTDAWIVEQGMQNPAAFSSFPRFLRLSREGKAEELGAMICKMTGGAAQRFGLVDRGRIEKGCFADLVLFDKNNICEEAGESAPLGLPHVIINGEFAVKDGQYLEKSLGKGLKV